MNGNQGIKHTQIDKKPYINTSSRKWLALAILCTATFMTMLDSFIVNVAVPSIQNDLNSTPAEIQFVIVGYIIAYGVLLITGGRMGDIFGIKNLFLGGMAGFTLASFLCGIAPNSIFLIISRILQGITAALMVPQVIAYIHNSFQDKERNIALSLYGAVIGAATIIGQIAGGLLMKIDLFDLGWRSIFLINIPIGLISLLAAYPIIQNKVAASKGRLDLIGVLLLSLNLSLFILPIVMGYELGWPLWMFFCFVGSIIFFYLFLHHEHKMNARGGMALVNLQLFKDRVFKIGLFIVFAFFSGNAATFFIMAFHLQQYLQFTPLEAAYSYTPLGIGFLLGSFIVPKLIDRFGVNLLRIGSGFMIVGVSLMIAAVYYLPVLTWYDLIPATFLSGIGQGLVATPLIRMILSGINQKDTGAASGIISTVTVVAQGAGVSIVGTFYFTLIKSEQFSLVASPNYIFILSLLCILFLALVTGGLLFLLPEKTK